MDKKGFIVSFGDSNKYFVPFDGTIDEFMKSAEFIGIRDGIYSYVKSQFPSAHISADLQPAVHPAGDEDSDYSVFDEKTVEDLKKKSAREVEVELADKRLNLNAPEDIIS